MSFRLALSALILACSAASPAHAQDWQSWGTMMQENVNSMIMWDGLRSHGAGTPDMLPAMSFATALPDGALAFAPDPALRASVLAEGRSATADTGLAIDAPFGDRSATGRLGLSDADLADVLTAYLITLHSAANSGGQPDAATVAAVRGQARSMLGAVSGDSVPDAKTMQKAADQMSFRLAMLNAIRDSGMLTAPDLAREARRQGLEDFGFDLTAVVLTEAGFARR